MNPREEARRLPRVTLAGPKSRKRGSFSRYFHALRCSDAFFGFTDPRSVHVEGESSSKNRQKSPNTLGGIKFPPVWHPPPFGPDRLRAPSTPPQVPGSSTVPSCAPRSNLTACPEARTTSTSSWRSTGATSSEPSLSRNTGHTRVPGNARRDARGAKCWDSDTTNSRSGWVAPIGIEPGTTGTRARTSTPSSRRQREPASTASTLRTRQRWFRCSPPGGDETVRLATRSLTRSFAGTPPYSPTRSFARVTRCGTGSRRLRPRGNTSSRGGSGGSNSSPGDWRASSGEPRWRPWTARGPSSRTWDSSADPPAACSTSPGSCTPPSPPTPRRFAETCSATRDPRGCSEATWSPRSRLSPPTPSSLPSSTR